MKVWSVRHKNHEIRVENGWFSGERLIVDGEVQDQHLGFAFRSQLQGKIRDGDGAGEIIRVSLGGWFSINCTIFIDDKLIPIKG